MVHLMGNSFFSVGDRVVLATPDGDGHFKGRKDDGTVTHVVNSGEVFVEWDNGDQDILTDGDLDLA